MQGLQDRREDAIYIWRGIVTVECQMEMITPLWSLIVSSLLLGWANAALFVVYHNALTSNARVKGVIGRLNATPAGAWHPDQSQFLVVVVPLT